MKQVQTRITINTPIERVWEVLTNFPAHHAWNPTIPQLAGEKRVGGKIAFEVRLPDNSPMKFKAKILAYAPNEELCWRGVLFTRWLFAGEHYFRLRAISPTETELEHGENFSGLLLGLVGLTGLFPKTEKGFIAMNEALKKNCECNC